MQDIIDTVTQPNVALLRLRVAALLGGLVGVERERSQVLLRRMEAMKIEG